ncbi:hypothetical protein Dvina_05645 [Dactylosporangium vinaceum]|uniref:SCO2522 family protein n=1 Tax=Dactylosporangium vinaceum TaxID=53362 RepID=A0ABV5MIJ8_9ACTN|nr:SCO2522 family protein [Dactylosporangium vinaceum]UAB97626.1 hypothetical protein Dvina_05645 [Dactylosporangium vinaceum]
MITNVEYREPDRRPRTVSLPLSHVSIEVGHLYAEDFRGRGNRVEEHLAQVAPWVHQARAACEARLPKGVRPRISTCFLINDHLPGMPGPRETIERLQKAAADNGLTIDYLARESNCAVADGIPLAELVLSYLVSDPPPATTGGRPPVVEAGWLCNGQRTPGSVAPAMHEPSSWEAPRENNPTGHSIFVDVELWSRDQHGSKVYSCAFLASVWQLLRLGLLRHNGEPAVRPRGQDRDEDWPEEWEHLPGVLQLNERAWPFAAYRTNTVLREHFLSVEVAAVRTILSQVSPDPAVLDELAARSRHEGVPVPEQLIKRMGYVFVND